MKHGTFFIEQYIRHPCPRVYQTKPQSNGTEPNNTCMYIFILYKLMLVGHFEFLRFSPTHAVDPRDWRKVALRYGNKHLVMFMNSV